jgi:diaphanous 3
MEVMMFRFSFLEHYNKLKLDILSALEAFQCITKSEQFQKLMHMVLVLGNYMNAATNNRLICGFRVGFLAKVADIKGQGGVTPLRLIAKLIHDTDPAVAECLLEMKPLRQLKNVAFKALEDRVKEMSRELEMVHREVEQSQRYHESKKYHQNDALFISKLTEFHREVTSKFSFVKKEHQTLLQQIKECMKFFGEPDDTKLTPEELLQCISKFLGSVEQAMQDHEKSLKSPKVYFDNKEESNDDFITKASPSTYTRQETRE